ncbi:hypothetical protein K432DRAFT_294905, partial [Lepidopterella palustris CBS 459.81]
MSTRRSHASTKLSRFSSIRNFGQSQNNKWHKQIEEISSGWTPNNPEYTTDQCYPSVQLRVPTDAYLASRARLSPDEREACLVELVKGHHAKDTAIVACAHALSPQTLRGLLRGELQVSAGSYSGALTYLRVIEIAYQANPASVSPLEAQCAQVLISLSTSDLLVLSRRLQGYVRLLSGGVPSDLLHPSMVDGMLRSACKTFAFELESRRQESQWASAYPAIDWLSSLPNTCPYIEQLLDEVFPDWRVWAKWRPNFIRL